MQVSATLIAAQQAAREARSRLAMPQAAIQAPAPAPFAAALQEATGPAPAFAALPLKQTAAAPAQPQATTAPARMGQHINIVV